MLTCGPLAERQTAICAHIKNCLGLRTSRFTEVGRMEQRSATSHGGLGGGRVALNMVGARRATGEWQGGSQWQGLEAVALVGAAPAAAGAAPPPPKVRH